MVILRTRNKITDFLMILAWASPFNNANVYGILTLATHVSPYMEIQQIIKLIYICFSLQIMF